ncbi:molybdopterin oxidoreductase [Mucilaginibacter lacusdianchii]|uniref:molybdopterin oxidoreductase n=1 Tax=Mucilaginibacter lacusdianchii TaxID=2684211 RepID=UPI00131DEFFC|nr:molybdopterin oxidoreductase [Mucilaginibacter sp. JXJ CY 39]
MLIGNYLQLAFDAEKEAVKAFNMIAGKHGDEPDVYQTCQLLASWSQNHLNELKPWVEKYPARPDTTADKLERMMFDNEQKGSFALLRDLHDLWILVTEIDICWTVLLQAADGLRDKEMKTTFVKLQESTKRQIAWLQTRIKQSAPQTLIVGV